ncbi:MAG: N-acetylglucosamine kinase [Cyclobacteriaceae bacterium]
MILVADSGSTKTEWRLIAEDGEISQLRTSGINPYYQKEEDILEMLRAELEDFLKKEVTEIYFYGAGCSSQANKEKITRCFQSIYANAKVEVSIDLLAAARALCGVDRGIACILGTGANSCLYDGREITENVPSLGFIMGDEGSGSYLGNKLLGQFMRKQLPQVISDRLKKRFDLSNDTILANVYQGDAPIVYMSGFSKFIFQNIKEPYLYQFVYDSFKSFFTENILRYPNYENEPIHFTGSVAFYFSNILRKVAADMQLNVRHIVEGPIAGLALYHKNQMA